MCNKVPVPLRLCWAMYQCKAGEILCPERFMQTNKSSQTGLGGKNIIAALQAEHQCARGGKILFWCHSAC